MMLSAAQVGHLPLPAQCGHLSSSELSATLCPVPKHFGHSPFPPHSGQRRRPTRLYPDMHIPPTGILSWPPADWRERYSFAFRNRNALPITLTELNVIATAAIIGLSITPKMGYSAPAAIGMPSAL
jgi:hypothetical protein